MCIERNHRFRRGKRGHDWPANVSGIEVSSRVPFYNGILFLTVTVDKIERNERLADRKSVV